MSSSSYTQLTNNTLRFPRCKLTPPSRLLRSGCGGESCPLAAYAIERRAED